MIKQVAPKFLFFETNTWQEKNRTHSQKYGSGTKRYMDPSTLPHVRIMLTLMYRFTRFV